MTRGPFLAAGLALFATGCGASPTSPPAAAPVRPTFVATLSAGNETPPVTNAESTVSGTVTITFDTTTSGGNLTSATATFVATLDGVPAGTSISAAHIHKAAAGTPGAIVIGASVSSAAVAGAAAISLTLTNPAPDLAAVQDILNAPAGYYFDLHSPLNPNGFARGQLSRVQ